MWVVSSESTFGPNPYKSTSWTAVVTFRLNILSIPVGATLGEGSGATMSEDEDDLHMDFSSDNSGVDFNGGHDMTGFGPLLPTESERSLMERVRQELKIELKQVSYMLGVSIIYNMFFFFWNTFMFFLFIESF